MTQPRDTARSPGDLEGLLLDGKLSPPPPRRGVVSRAAVINVARASTGAGAACEGLNRSFRVLDAATVARDVGRTGQKSGWLYSATPRHPGLVQILDLLRRCHLLCLRRGVVTGKFAESPDAQALEPHVAQARFAAMAGCVVILRTQAVWCTCRTTVSTMNLVPTLIDGRRFPTGFRIRQKRSELAPLT
jgi:hypothetical protein